VLGKPAKQCTKIKPPMVLDKPIQPSTWLMGKSTTWKGMNTPKSRRPKNVSLPRNFHRLST